MNIVTKQAIIFCFFIVQLLGSSPHKLILSRIEQNNYALQVDYQKKNFNLSVQLNHEKSWIKSSQCKVCLSQKCEQSCLADDQTGIKCISKNCKIVEQSYSQNNILAGKIAAITVKALLSKQNVNIELVLVDQFESNQQQIGKINLLQDNLFGEDKILLVKDHKSDVTLFYGNDSLTQDITILEDFLIVNSDEQDPNIFQASQIKLKDALKLKQGQKIEIPMIKTNAEIQFSTEKLLLPQKIFTKLSKALTSSFLNASQCQLNKKSEIVCKKSIDLEVLQTTMIQITLNGIEIQFPLRALFTSCSAKKCSILLGISSHKKNIVIGSFILDIFAIEHISKDNDFKFYRLNNQWGQKFTKSQVYKTKKINFILALLFIVIKVIWWLVRAILYLAVFSLLLNCLYHRNQVFGWFIQIKDKLAQKAKSNKPTQRKGKFRQQARFISSIHDSIDDDDFAENEL